MTVHESAAQELRELARCERSVVAQFIASLERFDRLRLYLPLGYSSTYSFCVSSLSLSECAAYARIEIARLARRFPRVLRDLEDGSITITTAGLLVPHVTDASADALLDMCRGRSKREVQRIVAAIAGPSVPRIHLHLMITLETEARLQEARELLRHVIPNGDPSDIFDRALRLLVGELRRRKFADVTRARQESGSPPTGRTIPASVRRAVEERDAGQCAFIGTEGRCRERGFLEFHHVRPFADGGEPTVANIELRCRAHNAYEACLHFGELGPDPVSTVHPQGEHAVSAT